MLLHRPPVRFATLSLQMGFGFERQFSRQPTSSPLLPHAPTQSYAQQSRQRPPGGAVVAVPHLQLVQSYCVHETVGWRESGTQLQPRGTMHDTTRVSAGAMKPNGSLLVQSL